MFLQRSSRVIRAQWQLYGGWKAAARGAAVGRWPARGFHASRSLRVVKPVLLADIGEGIVECEIIQWFVEPEARVEEFSPLCEVQSDKASVEITSRFSGIVKKLYYEAGEMAKVGKPFVDIDIQGDVKKEDLEAIATAAEEPSGGSSSAAETSPSPPAQSQREAGAVVAAAAGENTKGDGDGDAGKKGKHASLATPAVRHVCKELDVDIAQVSGSGKDGRVLKEDIYKFVERRDNAAPADQRRPAAATAAADSAVQTETRLQLTGTQLHMFKAMTRSLAIPHFLYADEVDFTSLSDLRTRLNGVLAKSAAAAAGTAPQHSVSRLSYLPFIIKAVSMALYQYPTLNAWVDVPDDGPAARPALVLRSQHNVGVAMDTPAGLVVPVVKNVNSRNILSIAAELVRLQALALTGKLAPADLTGGTITVSNIGNIGGTYLSPVVVEREVAILGVGRVRTVPAFDEADRVVKRQTCHFSWSADHRVVDGATLARAAEVVRQVVEEPDVMIMQLR